MRNTKRLWAAAPSVSMLSLLSVGSLLALSSAAHAALGPSTDSRVTFSCAATAGLGKIEGNTGELSVAEDAGNISITVPLANLTTGIGLRDKHMKEKYLEVQTFPTATLVIARSALKLPAAGEKVESDVPGLVKLHGKTKTVNVHYDAKAEGGAMATHGQFHINMNDFGIAVPSYLGVTVKPDVDVSASFHVAGS